MARAAPKKPDGDAPRFEMLYRSCYEDLLRYALRRTGRPEAAADVVADAFLVAWQRIGDIPPDNARAWLFGVARNVLANQYRVTVVQPDVPAEVAAAFRELSDADQEILRLVAWEGLTADELAVVFDCSANAARIRLHRARARFTEALQSPSLTS